MCWQRDLSENRPWASSVRCGVHVNSPVTLISNQQESNRTSRNEEFSKFASHSGGSFKPSHTIGGMSRNDGGMEIMYIFLDNYAIRRCSEIRPDSFEGQSGRSDWIQAAFEQQSKDSDDIWIAFQLNSCNIEIDSGSNRNAFEVHSGSFRGAFGTFWQDLKWLAVSILLRRRSECF